MLILFSQKKIDKLCFTKDESLEFSLSFLAYRY